VTDVRGDVQVANENLQSASSPDAPSVCEALANVVPHKLPVPVTNCHESPDDVESFLCRTRGLLGIGTPIGDVRFVDGDIRGPCTVVASLFGDTWSVPDIFL